jgi:UDP-N-acetylmuramoylalanine--D-glutamate ligase
MEVIMELTGKKVMVVGTGISGIGAAGLLNRVSEDIDITLYDSNEKVKKEDVEKKLAGSRADIVVGSEPYEKPDLLVISPGVPIDSDIVKKCEAENVPVWGEIELAYNYDKGKVIAITGTNGKTTTTSLVGQIVGAYIKDTFVVGNIGNSYTKEVLNTTKDSCTVAEISSFQLETVHSFHPVVSAILNITPDHLNRHHTMECYAQTKEKIAMNQTKEDTCVLNYDDELLREYGKECPAGVYWFSRKEKPETGAFMEGDVICFTDGKNTQQLLNVHDMNLIGAHNYENVMAAVCITKAAGIPDEIIIREIKSFKAVEHRIEYVTEKNGVVYYNDSKGTNPEAAVKAVEAMTRPTILIGGGYDKGAEFDIYVQSFKDRVKLLVLLGQTSDKIAETAEKYGFTNIIKAESLKEVVDICAANAVSGDAVLLSPACASWGMFDNYEQRGRMFKDYVNAL